MWTTSKKSTPKPAPIKSIRALAKLLDKSHTAVQEWLKDDRWPFSRTPPWPPSVVPQILRWAAENLQEDRADPAADPQLADLRRQKLQVEIRRLSALAEGAQLALDEQREKLLDAAEVKTRWAKIGAAVRTGVQALPSTILPVALRLGMPPTASTQFQRETQQTVNAALAALAEKAGDDE